MSLDQKSGVGEKVKKCYHKKLELENHLDHKSWRDQKESAIERKYSPRSSKSDVKIIKKWDLELDHENWHGHENLKIIVSHTAPIYIYSRSRIWLSLHLTKNHLQTHSSIKTPSQSPLKIKNYLFVLYKTLTRPLYNHN